MAAVWQFVQDMASSSPAVLLDLNSYAGGLMVGKGYNLDPPKYDRGFVGGNLRHGQRPTRGVAANRTLRIPLELFKSSGDAAAATLESLGRQLAVDSILKVQIDNTTNPVFFRTFANPDYATQVRSGFLVRNSHLELELEAEPFAYGPRVDVNGGTAFTVANDPAAGTNPCRFDITGVQGDVPTPLLLVATSTGASGTPSGLVSKRVHVSTRRRGTPSGYSNVVQAEGMGLGLNATVTADAAMSGGSKVRISFGTSTLQLRLQSVFPANNVSTIEARGEYRVYAKLAKTVAADPVTVQLGYGATSAAAVMNAAVTLPTTNTGPWLVDLGLVPVPAWADPVALGYSGVQTKVILPFLGLWASRASGTTNLDIDYLYFMPADEPTTVIAQFPATDNVYAIDGTTDAGGSVYSITAALDEIITTASAPQVVGGGGFPEVIPGVTNRIHLLRQVDQFGTVDALANTTTIKAYYWPRWRGSIRS